MPASRFAFSSGLEPLSLWYLFYTDNYSMAYVAAHSNRALSPYYKFSALWSGQEGSLLFWSFLLSIYVFSALFTYRGKHPELMPYVGVVLAGVQIFFLTMNNFIASPFQVFAGTRRRRDSAPGDARRWQRPQSAPAISGDGHPSAHAVFGLHGLHDSVCVCAGRAAWPISGREVDSSDAPLDHDRLGVSVGGNSARRALGLCRARMGRLLGLGPGRKCVPDAVADGNGVSALGDHAGKARDDARVERLAGLSHVHVMHPGHFADAQRRGQFGPRLCGIEHRPLVLGLSAADHPRVPRGLFQESRLPAQRQSTRLHALARVQLPVQQPDSAGCLRRGSGRDALPGALGSGARIEDQRRPSVFQSREYSHRDVSACS